MYILLGKSLDLWMKNGYFSLKKKKGHTSGWKIGINCN